MTVKTAIKDMFLSILVGACFFAAISIVIAAVSVPIVLGMSHHAVWACISAIPVAIPLMWIVGAAIRDNSGDK